MGALFGASLGVVLAALLDVSAPLAFDGGVVSPSWTARSWLIGALVGAIGGYVLGALIAWELADDPVPPMDLHGTSYGIDPASLPIPLEALDPPDSPESRSEPDRH
jgi:hypothetical protein